MFEHPPVVVRSPAGEIDDLRWLDVTGPLPGDLAPLLTQHVLPALRQRG